jgi:hypothetical protein
VRIGRVLGLGVAFLAGLEARAGDEEKLVARSFALNPYNGDLDGQWQASRVASDGRCYFASSTHSARRGAAFFRYDPAKGELSCLSKDLNPVCGEDASKTPPQGKVHSDIVEEGGWIYFATHLANYWPEAEKAYTGAHVLGLELASGKFRDFGVVHPNHSIYSGIAVDRERRRLWVITRTFNPDRKGEPSMLYWIDLRTGEKRRVGEVSPGGASFYLFVDRRGDCWFTVSGGRGCLYVARAEGRIERFEGALPEGGDWWDWAQPLADGDRCVFLMGYNPQGRLWVFDSTREIGPGAFKAGATVGMTHLGQALAGGRVYLVQRRDPAAKWASGGGGENDLHLRSLPVGGEGGVADHGLIVDQDGRFPWRIHAVSADGKGRVFMTGDWHLRPGEEGSEKGMLRHDTGDRYKALPRGQFFAVADVGRQGPAGKP